ncbi:MULTISPECIES: aspartyl/asparaginyl beta-hydroxylase domain-containing protein [unclassified Sphingomonas]|uniref:aspartyl/asparaginyl beta-hydroxylase domain-containing protein n=1 Tax=Sphingomonas TaxID=13687 RepID=UPI000965AD69|nr:MULTISPECIES: aspartyl/asparaginyl beta-hydroxylase domain-containing protein [unclassified Sphingomonas]MBN8810542.1 aspartyl/asparaginyl beta-hydroxylase domain-containing protein [Sphingomonas sp.]OJY51059.1 MAG: aspartyl beta-hydroxylase [Sphingomonas sp. 67-41]
MATISAQSAWPDRVRLPLAFDPAPLAADIAALERGDWTAHFVQRNYEGEWSALPLRAPAGAAHPVQQIYSAPGVTAFVDTPWRARMPALSAAIDAFACPVRSVRLMRLAAGSVIKEHADFDLDAAQGFARIHVPVLTSDDVDFRLNGTRVTMAPGEAWYLRLADPHSVANRGRSARVHLVLDLVVDDWLLRQLEG